MPPLPGQSGLGVVAPRSFSDYAVEVDETNLPGGVKLIRKVG